MKLLIKLLRFPRRQRTKFYIRWNRLLFTIHGIKFGCNMRVHNRVFISKCEGARMTVGDNFVFTSGDAHNPLCRNIEGSIYLAMPTSVIEIGDNTGISSACLWAKERITIGNRVNIGGDCLLMDTDAHSLDYRLRASNERIGKMSADGYHAAAAPIVIEDDVLIGTRCIILKGVTIGARSVIGSGSGSIVTKDIPADCVAAGNPCKVIRKLR